jgi:hypothetical protein
MICKIKPSSTYVFWYIIKMVSTKLFIIRRCISIEKRMLLCWLVQVFHNPKKFENQSFGVVETTTLKIMASRSPSMFSASFVCFLSVLSLSLLYLACVFFLSVFYLFSARLLFLFLPLSASLCFMSLILSLFCLLSLAFSPISARILDRYLDCLLASFWPFSGPDLWSTFWASFSGDLPIWFRFMAPIFQPPISDSRLLAPVVWPLSNDPRFLVPVFSPPVFWPSSSCPFCGPFLLYISDVHSGPLYLAQFSGRFFLPFFWNVFSKALHYPYS